MLFFENLRYEDGRHIHTSGLGNNLDCGSKVTGIPKREAVDIFIVSHILEAGSLSLAMFVQDPGL